MPDKRVKSTKAGFQFWPVCMLEVNQPPHRGHILQSRDFCSRVCRWLISYLKVCFSSKSRGRASTNPTTEALSNSEFIQKDGDGFILLTLVGTYRTVVAAGHDVDCLTQAGEVYRRLFFFFFLLISQAKYFLDCSIDPSKGCRHGMKEWRYECSCWPETQAARTIPANHSSEFIWGKTFSGSFEVWNSAPLWPRRTEKSVKSDFLFSSVMNNNDNFMSWRVFFCMSCPIEQIRQQPWLQSLCTFVQVKWVILLFWCFSAFAIKGRQSKPLLIEPLAWFRALPWVTVTREGFLIDLDMAVEVQTLLASCVFMLAGRYQSYQEVDDGFLSTHGLKPSWPRTKPPAHQVLSGMPWLSPLLLIGPCSLRAEASSRCQASKWYFFKNVSKPGCLGDVLNGSAWPKVCVNAISYQTASVEPFRESNSNCFEESVRGLIKDDQPLPFPFLRSVMVSFPLASLWQL